MMGSRLPKSERSAFGLASSGLIGIGLFLRGNDGDWV